MTLLSCLIGLVQMTVVMLIAGLAARSLRPRSPGSAAGVGITGLITGLSLMLLTLVNMPRLVEIPVVFPSPASFDRSSGDESPAIAAATLGAERLQDGSSSIELPLGAVMDWLGHQSVADRESHRWLPCFAIIRWLAMLSLVGLLPLMIGLIATARLDQTSRPISQHDEAVLRALTIGISGHDVRFRVSEIVSAPCVTLYGGRSIYLPVDWAEWSDGEISAALAHESAHLNRRDPLKRLIGQFALSLMIFHPLATWLYRGTILSQEMAADRDAVTALGNRFIGSLSRMALRIDAALDRSSRPFDKRQWFLRPGIVSVSSSHLIRRIEMLTRYPKGCVPAKSRWLPQAVMIVIFACCACWNVSADPPSESAAQAEAKPAVRVAELPKRMEQQKSRLFTSPALEPWEILRPNSMGYAALRVEELLRHPVVGRMLRGWADPLLEKAWGIIVIDEAAPNRAALGLSLDNLEHLVASLNVEMAKKQAEDSSAANGRIELIAGSSGGMLQFRQPVSYDSIESSIDWSRIVQILIDNGIRPSDLGDRPVAEFVDRFRDDTFIDGGMSRELRLTPQREGCDQQQLARLQCAWRLVDGGIVAACWSLPETIGHVENQYDEYAERIHASAAGMAIGVDLGSGAEPAHVRLALVPRAHVSAEALESAVGRLLDLIEQNIDSLVDDEEGVNRAERLREVLRSADVDVKRAEGDAELDCVVATFRLPLTSFAMLSGL